MSDENTGEIVPLMHPPSKVEAQKIIRELVSQDKIRFHKHCKTRMRQRKVSSLQVLTILKKGRVNEEPSIDYGHKGWNTSVEGSAAGEWLKVAVNLQWSQNILVITCY